MSIKEDLEKHRGEPAEQRLAILRRELLRPIVTVESSAHLLQTVSDQIYDCLPEEISASEFKNTVVWLAEAARDLHQILDALTSDTSQVREQHGRE